MKSIRSLWAAGLLVAVMGPAQAEPPSPPPFYAITNVEVVTGTGQTLEEATVLVADGPIEAVGTGVTVPGDAWVIDGEGMNLYPGLIDAMTTVGQKQEEASSGGSPLEITTQVEHLIINGREISTDNMHQRLYAKYRSRPRH
jgi:imidazolonepropionase-like amidohydrolase